MIIDNNQSSLNSSDNYGANSAIGDISFGRITPEARALFNKASELGFRLPSSANQLLINKLLIDIKQAAGGLMTNIFDIRLYANDLPDTSIDGLLRFDGLHLDDPNKSISRANSLLSKLSKRGYRGNNTTSGYIITETPVDIINNTLHRNDLSVMWVWYDIINVGAISSGISIFTQSRAVACAPKHTATQGFIQMGGRGLAYNVNDGFNIYTAEIINGNVNAYINNVLASTNTLLWGTDFQSIMLDLGANNQNSFTLISNSTTFPSTSTTIGACIMYRSSMVNRTDLYNAVLSYFTELQNI